jgi:tetratricopeptide (TPR) repeat protein
MKSWLIAALIMIVLPLTLIGQNWTLVFTKEQEAEVLIKEKQYQKAAERYLEALKLAPNSANLKYKVGYAYLLTPDNKHFALDYLKDAEKDVSSNFNPKSIKEVTAPPIALYYLGISYLIAKDFAKAKETFIKYKSFLSPNDEFVEIVNLRIASCDLAPKYIENKKAFVTSNLGSNINTNYPNFNPVFSGNGTTMAYTVVASRGYEVLVSKKEGNDWGKPTRISNQLKSIHLKTSSISYDGTQLYLIDDFSPTKNIFHSMFDGKAWTKAQALKAPINSKENETHAFISSDGKTLYFTSDRPGGNGGLDIYTSTLDSKGAWGNPQNVGSRINTKYNEDTPFVTADGKYLFFSSEGHNSMGGYDVFFADILGSSNPQNFGYPINNTDDNLFFFPVSRSTGYMAFNAPNSYGPTDIHSISIVNTVNLQGKITSSDIAVNNSLGKVAITVSNLSTKSLVSEISINPGTTQFSLNLPPGNYGISAITDGFQEFHSVFNIANDFSEPDYTVNVVLVPNVSIPQFVEEVIVEKTPVEEKSRSIAQPTQVQNQPEVREEPRPKVETPPVAVVETKKVEKEEPKKSAPIVEKVESELQKKETKANINITPRSDGQIGMYTVQIMALIFPVPVDHFANISGVRVERGSDGINRYTVGEFKSIAEAKVIQKQLISLGYKDAFIRKIKAN